MLDLLIHNASLPDGRKNMSVAVRSGRIVEVTEGLMAPAAEVVDASHRITRRELVLPLDGLLVGLSFDYKSRIIEGQKTLLNRTVLSKFGFRAAEISIAFRRRK